MPVINKVPPWKDFTCYQLGDTHIGTIAHSQEKLKEAIYIIKNEKKSLWIHTGDAAETIMVDDPRYEQDQHTTPTADRQVDEVIETFHPIRKQLLAFLYGNHELRLKKNLNMIYAVCKGLERLDAYGGWTSIVNFHDKAGHAKWTGFWTHGPLKARGGLGSSAGDAGQKKANTEASLKKMLAPLHNAHYMGAGHFHKLVLREPVRELYLTTKGKNIKQEYTGVSASGYIHPDQRWYGCNGGFLKQYLMGENYPNDSLATMEPMTYSEIAGYPPVEMGLIQINVRDYMIHSCEKVVL